MTSLRTSSRSQGRLFLALICVVLAMNAFIPAGYMIAPSANHFFTVTPCPSSNPLARVSSKAAEPHAAIDHAAMRHVPSSIQDEAPVSAQSNVDCAFSALTFAATVPEKPASLASVLDGSHAADTFLPVLAIVRKRYLRPPLRAPPSQV